MQNFYQLYRKYYIKWKLEQKRVHFFTPLLFLFTSLSKLKQLLFSKFYLRQVNTGKMVMCRKKPSLLTTGNISIGDGSKIWSQFTTTRLAAFKGAEIQIGKNTFINGSRIAAKNKIIIGDNIHIAPEVIIMDSDFHDTQKHDEEGQSSPIVIENNVWIATRAMILKGVHIGEGAVIAAGSIVTKNVEPYTLVAGTPAKIIKYLK